jgi:PleD family two-component response regulator
MSLSRSFSGIVAVSTLQLKAGMPTILFADDEPAIRELVARYLELGGHRVQLATNGKEALELVRRGAPDLIVLDYHMGDPDGFQVCRHLKNSPRFGHLPVLILTGRNTLETRLAGYDAGADDYLAKPFDPRELLARIGALLRLANRGLQRNPTSGLPGGEAIQQEFARWTERNQTFAVCYLDLDDFKPFGDRFGFSVADEVIRIIGEVLRHVTEDRDAFVGHVGGDDFIMICRDDEARALCQQAQEQTWQRILDLLPAEVVRSGRYHAEARDGSLNEFRITRLSTAILRLHPGAEVSLTQFGESVARVKRMAKLTGAGIAEADLVG